MANRAGITEEDNESSRRRFFAGEVVVEAGDPREIISNPQHERTKKFPLHRKSGAGEISVENYALKPRVIFKISGSNRLPGAGRRLTGPRGH